MSDVKLVDVCGRRRPAYARGPKRPDEEIRAVLRRLYAEASGAGRPRPGSDICRRECRCGERRIETIRAEMVASGELPDLPPRRPSRLDGPPRPAPPPPDPHRSLMSEHMARERAIYAGWSQGVDTWD